MSGWEIHESARDLLLSDPSPLSAFCQSYGPLADFNAQFNTLAVLRKYHPGFNCAPDDELDPTDDFSMRIGLYSGVMETFYFVPKNLTYLSLELVEPALPAVSAPDYLIETAEYGVTRTNNYELSLLAPDYKPLSDDAMVAAYAMFDNVRPVVVQRIPITSTSIELSSVGRLERTEFDDWFSITARVSLIDMDLPITVMDFHPNDPAQAARLALFDAAVAAFLNLDGEARASASKPVLKNCHDHIEAVGENEWNEAMASVTNANADAIWAFVYPRDVYVRYDDETKRVYVSLMCECEWEQEHGLQLVYTDGNQLTRVCEEGGHVWA